MKDSSSSSIDTDSSSSRAEPTGKYIVTNGTSSYTIVISEDADANVSFAASELQSFLKASTDALLPIVSDSSLSSVDGYYISLGSTKIFDHYEITIPESLGRTGYVMKRMDDTLLINAIDGAGVYSAVYDMLSDAINLEIYSHDEYTYDTKTEVELLDYNVEFEPLMDMRRLILKNVSSSTLYRRRLRLYSDLQKGKWAAFAHTTITKYLPYNTYGTAHKDWYNAGGTQVCYSNPEVLNAIADAMKTCILDNPEAIWIQMGHEDNLDMCTCDNCIAERELYGGYGGQELEFTNKLEEILDPWLAKVAPERSMKYVFFAYQTSQEPPAKWDEATQKYVPVSSKFRVNDNVMVMYCPIDADFSKKMSDPKNATQYNQLTGWGDIFDSVGKHGEIFVWTYSLSALASMVPLNNFGVYEEHYAFFSKVGVKQIIDQSYSDTGTPSLEALKAYTQARLMYTQKESYQELATKFMNQYYGEAREAMKKYYNLLRSHYKYLEETKGLGAYVKSDLYQSSYWSYEILNKFFSLMEEGIEAISVIKESNPNRYKKLYDRLRTEECFPIYMILRFYMSELSPNEKKEYWNIFSEYSTKGDMIGSAESTFDMSEQIETWRTSIFGE